MATIREIYNVLFDFAPADMKLDWDNVGLACGHFDAEVHKILVALDPMPDVFEEAKARSCELVVTHHPLLFQGVKQVNSGTYAGNCLLYLIENGIAAMNLHTNLDCCPGGVNDVLGSEAGTGARRNSPSNGNGPAGSPLRSGAHGNGAGAVSCGLCVLRQAGAFLPRRPIRGCRKICAQSRSRRRQLRQRDRCGLSGGCDTFVTATSSTTSLKRQNTAG